METYHQICTVPMKFYVGDRVFLSDMATRLEGQRMFQILAKAQQLERDGRDILHFEIGDPQFDTPSSVIEACKTALDEGNTHYVPSIGMQEFRSVAAKRTLASRGFKPDLDQILVTAGANIQIFYAIACTVNPGEEVISIDPAFVSYESIAKTLGVNLVKVPLRESNEFRLDPSDIQRAITSRTKMIIINSPHNPTGAVMREEEIKETYKIAERENIYLFSDEVYGRIVYDDSDTGFYSPTVYDACKDRTILSHSFSKSYAMTGWRIGGVTGPRRLIEKMALLLETTSSCVSPFIQKAAIEAMQGSQLEIDNMVSALRVRRDLFMSEIQDIPSVSCVTPKGAFYAFVNIMPTGMDSVTFSDKLLDEAGVATCPGVYFGDAGEGYVRFCFARSREEIIDGMQRLESWILSK